MDFSVILWRPVFPFSGAGGDAYVCESSGGWFLGWLLASEPLTMRVVLASVAILGAIVLIRKGERTTKATASVTLPAEVRREECA